MSLNDGDPTFNRQDSQFDANDEDSQQCSQGQNIHQFTNFENEGSIGDRPYSRNQRSDMFAQ